MVILKITSVAVFSKTTRMQYNAACCIEKCFFAVCLHHINKLHTILWLLLFAVIWCQASYATFKKLVLLCGRWNISGNLKNDNCIKNLLTFFCESGKYLHSLPSDHQVYGNRCGHFEFSDEITVLRDTLGYGEACSR